jgi:hypothetical protein
MERTLLTMLFNTQYDLDVSTTWSSHSGNFERTSTTRQKLHFNLGMLRTRRPERNSSLQCGLGNSGGATA